MVICSLTVMALWQNILALPFLLFWPTGFGPFPSKIKYLAN